MKNKNRSRKGNAFVIILVMMFFGVILFLSMAYKGAENGQKRELRIEQARFGRAMTKAEIEIAKQNRIGLVAELNTQVKIARIEAKSLRSKDWSEAFAIVGSSIFYWLSTPLTQLGFLAVVLSRLYLSSPVLPAPNVFRRVAGIRQHRNYEKVLEVSSSRE